MAAKYMYHYCSSSLKLAAIFYLKHFKIKNMKKTKLLEYKKLPPIKPERNDKYYFVVIVVAIIIVLVWYANKMSQYGF
jgi:hypothetical protein